MAKIQKTFPSPYGGISEQSVELMLDQQCIDMVNCVPDVVIGLQRRNGIEASSNITSSGIFHTYDRGEGDEKYVIKTTGVAESPLAIYDINGVSKTINYNNVANINSYLSIGLIRATLSTGLIRATTIQDKTFVVNTTKVVGQDIREANDVLFDRVAYYWLSRSSNDENNKYNYAVYLDDHIFQYASPKSDIGSYTDSADVAYYGAAKGLSDLINASGEGFTAVAKGSVIQITKSGLSVRNSGGSLRIPYDTTHKYVAVRPTINGTTEYVDVTKCDTTITPVEDTLCYKLTVQGYYLEHKVGTTTAWKTFTELAPIELFDVPYYVKLGSTYVDKLYRIGMDCVVNSAGAFTFSYWDSWGSQASYGWKGYATRLDKLPTDLGFIGAKVAITGDDKSSFTDYYLEYDGDTWVETINPQDNRSSFTNMPISITRETDGTFSATLIDWELPHVGDSTTNPTPSFVGQTISDIFFYKNRLGFASGDNIILSETGGYYNFYSKTALEVVDDDPIDLAVASNDATNIYYVIPFQRTLFVFTKDNQYELKYSQTFSPNTVSFDLVSRVPIDTTVQPINAGSSLFFISRVGNNASQLREYRYNNDSLIADGINLSIQTPNLLPKVNKLVVDSNLGLVLMYSNSTPTILYCYKYLIQGTEMVQAAFFKWSFAFSIGYMFVMDSILYLTTSSTSYKMKLLTNNNTKLDIDTPYISSCTLPRWNIKVTKLETPIDTLVIKRLVFIGEGSYNVDIFRKDYNTTTTRTYASNSTVDGSASILAKNKNVVITFRNNGNEPFRLDSMILEGMYTQTSKETN